MERESGIKIVVEKNTPRNTLTATILNNACRNGVEVVDIGSFNEERGERIILLSGQLGFIRPCPCSRNYRCCNYLTIDTIEGCVYNCEYCILKTFLNQSCILIKTDIDALRDELQRLYSSLLQRDLVLRIGTGELSDSLALEDIVPYAPLLIDETRGMDRLILEFKTKSNKIENIIGLPHNSTTTVSFSMSTAYLQRRLEKGTPSIAERIKAAKLLIDHNYKVGFHFDPIISYPEFERDYADTIRSIAKEIPPDAISWISLGTLRFNKSLLDKIESPILFSEYIYDMEAKLRYPITTRKRIYQILRDMIAGYFQKKVRIYLCMELDSLNMKIIGRAFRSDIELNNYIINTNNQQ